MVTPFESEFKTLSEKSFQDDVLELAKRLGVLAYHVYDSRRSVPGFPDLVLVGEHGVLWRELKTRTGRVTSDQARWLAALQAAGQDAGVWRPEDWPDRIVEEIRAIGRCRIPQPEASQAEVRKRLARRVSGTDYFPAGS